MSAYTCQQQFSLQKLAELSQEFSTESLTSSSSSSSSSRLYVVQFLDSAGVLGKQEDSTCK